MYIKTKKQNKTVALVTLVTSAAPMLMPHVPALIPLPQRHQGKAEERCAVPPVQWIKEWTKKVQGGGGKGACISIRACVWLGEEVDACSYKLR